MRLTPLRTPFLGLAAAVVTVTALCSGAAGLNPLPTPGIGPDPGFVGAPAVATNGETWVVVWPGGPGRTLRARAIAADGLPAGLTSWHAGGNAISPHEPPAIVWIGDRYVAAWADRGISSGVHFVELDSDGQPIPGTERLVTSGMNAPRLCWNGSRLLVLGGVGSKYGAYRAHILDPAGVAPARAVDFGDASFYQISCAPKDDGFVMVGSWWSELDLFDLDHDGNISKTKLDEGGPTGTDYHPWKGHAAVEGSRVHVFWTGATLEQAIMTPSGPVVIALADTSVAGGVPEDRIEAWRFDGHGTHVDSTPLVDSRRNMRPIVAAAATGYALTWLNDESYRSVRVVVTPDLTPLEPENGHLLSETRLSQSTPIIASTGSTGIVAWLEKDAAGTNLFTGVVDGNGGVGSVRLVGRGRIDQIVLTSGVGHALLSWAAYGIVTAIRLAPDGMRLDPQPVTLSPPGQYDVDFSVAWDGERYFCAYGSDSRIQGTFYDPAGQATAVALTEPEVIPPYASEPWESRPHVAASADGMLLAYESTYVYNCVGPPCTFVTTPYIVKLSASGEPDGPTNRLDRPVRDIVSSGSTFAALTGPHGCIQRYSASGSPLDDDPVCVAPAFAASLTATTDGWALAWTAPSGPPFVTVSDIPRDGSPRPARTLSVPDSTSVNVTQVVGRLLFGITQIVDERAKAAQGFVATEESFVPAPAVPQPPRVLSYQQLSSHSALLRWTSDPRAEGDLLETDANGHITGRAVEGNAIEVFHTGEPLPVRMRSWNSGGLSAPGPWLRSWSRTRGVRR
jgi:hypothetical protein